MDKNEVRKLIWDNIEKQKLFIPPKSPYGRIPNFRGADFAAKMLRNTEEWINSKIIFVSPDSAQIKIREYALKDKKIVIMASPKLKYGYLKIDPLNNDINEKEASTIKGAFKYGLSVDKFPKIDMVIEGSVAVDLEGNRLGKGKGYGDVEINHLLNQNVIDNKTPIVTTVHETQIIDNVPTEGHDKKINMIATPKRVIRINI